VEDSRLTACSQFHSDDANVLSVLKYAVDFVGVKHGALFLAIKKELIPTQKVPGWTKSFLPPSGGDKLFSSHRLFFLFFSFSLVSQSSSLVTQSAVVPRLA